MVFLKAKPTGLIADYFDLSTPVGTMTVATSKTAIVHLFFQSASREKVRRELRLLGYGAKEGRNALGNKAAKQLDAYFSGLRKDFTLPFELQGTGFQKRVWTELSQVPFGHVVSYGELAALAGFPRASRAVGSAMAKNRIPIVIPCHRVITSSRQLGGFGGGLELKRELLRLEGVDIAP